MTTSSQVIQRSNSNRKIGFTLIELLVVTAIMVAFVGTMAVGLVRSRDGANKSRAARAVLQLGRYARSVALLKQRPVDILFFDKGKIAVQVQAANSAANKNVAESDVGSLALALSTDKDSTFEDQYDAYYSATKENDSLDSYSETLIEEDKEEIYEGIQFAVEMLPEEGAISSFSYSAVNITGNIKQYKTLHDVDKAHLFKQDKKDEETEIDFGESVKIRYETNGRCKPYRVEVRRDEENDDRPLMVTVDRFGGVTIGEVD